MKNIKIPQPQWNSNIVNNILSLERLRQKEITGNLPPTIFFQLKNIFETLETIGSSRIEGNHTTLSEYVDTLIGNEQNNEEQFLEIQNLEQAIAFVDKHINDTPINKAFIFELHKIITQNLTKEGSKKPGQLRSINVAIKGSTHKPISFLQLPDAYEAFIQFINASYPLQDQILMIATAHHRFTHIHPFDNGNGRLSRVLNYALLLKSGFNTAKVINHSQIFYSNRAKYYEMLQKADSLKDEDVLSWCDYFIAGLKNEMEKINSLLEKATVIKRILVPALKHALQQQYITQKEYAILELIVKKPAMQIKAEALDKIGIKNSLAKSRAIKALKDKKMLSTTKERGRIYTLQFYNNLLLRSVIKSLKDNGYVDNFLETNE